MAEPSIAPGAASPAQPALSGRDEWKQEAQGSLLSERGKKGASVAGLAALTVAALGVVWYLKQTGETPHRTTDTELTVAERKPVAKLKDQPAEVVPAIQPASTPSAALPAEDPLKAQREQMDLQQREQERRMREARLKSAIIPGGPGQSSQLSQSSQVPSSQPADAEAVQTNPGMLSAAGGERGAQDTNSRFARAVSGSSVPQSRSSQLDQLPYKILQGKVIEAVLEPRAMSDLPGMICATVQRDVFGAQGRVALIPWGSRVCGVYSAELRKGQDRLFAVWNTVRRPDGVQVTLDSAGADQLGTAGMGGEVDTHFSQIFGMSALLSIIGAGASNTGVSANDQSNSASYYRQAVQQAAAQSSQQVLQPYVNIPPTVTVPAGSRIRIYVNRDLDFSGTYQTEIDAARRADTAAVTFMQ